MEHLKLALEPKLGKLDGVVSGFSTRRGGVSTGKFASLNLGANTGDQEEAIRANRTLFFGSFGVDPHRLAVAEQVHGNRVAFADKPGLYPNVDGLVTDRTGLALAIAAADCAAVLLLEPTARIIGACHSGWRGTAANIVGETIHVMKNAGANPSRMLAYVGPSVSAANFEVGDEVAAMFDARYVSRPDHGRRAHVDLKAALHDQLLSSGIDRLALEIAPYCTYERTGDFYSYRAEAGKTGRMMGFIMLVG